MVLPCPLPGVNPHRACHDCTAIYSCEIIITILNFRPSCWLSETLWSIDCWPGTTGYCIMLMWSCCSLYDLHIVFHFQRGRKCIMLIPVWCNLLCWGWCDLPTALSKIELLQIDTAAARRDISEMHLVVPGGNALIDYSDSEQFQWPQHSCSTALTDPVVIPG